MNGHTNVVCPCNGVLFSHKRGYGTDRCDHIGESCKHYAAGKKSDTKCHILFDSICMKYPEWVSRKQIGGFQGLGGGSNNKTYRQIRKEVVQHGISSVHPLLHYQIPNGKL